MAPGDPGAQVGAFERVHGDIDLGDLGAVWELGSDLLTDVEHGGFVALAFTDDDGAVHGDGVHGFAHGLGGDLVGVLAVALAHHLGAGDGRVLYHAQEFQAEVGLDVLSVALGDGFGGLCLCNGCHKCLRDGLGLRAPGVGETPASTAHHAPSEQGRQGEVPRTHPQGLKPAVLVDLFRHG